MSRKNWTNDKLFSKLLNNKTEKTYWDNVTELRRRPNIEVFEKSFSLAKSERDQEKIIGIDVLAQLGFNPRFKQKETIKLYFELIDVEDNEKVITSILYGISHNNENLTRNQISKLITFKDSDNVAIRRALVNSLCGLEDNLAIDTLIHLSKDKTSSVRDWATFGLGSQIETNNQKIVDCLWDRINDKDQSTKLEAIVGLAKRNDIRVKDIIIRELKAEENDTLLMEEIETLNDLEFLPYLEERLLLAKEEGIQRGQILALEETVENLKANNERTTKPKLD